MEHGGAGRLLDNKLQQKGLELDPSTFDWQARMIENVAGDRTELGHVAFRRLGHIEDSQKTITVVAPTKMSSLTLRCPVKLMSLAGQMRKLELEMKR